MIVVVYIVSVVVFCIAAMVLPWFVTPILWTLYRAFDRQAVPHPFEGD